MPNALPPSPLRPARTIRGFAALVLLAACQPTEAPPGDQVEAPPGTALIPGASVIRPDGEPARLAPFLVDRAPAGGAEIDGPGASRSWEDANAACQERGMRLPTDAEWQQLEAQPEGIEGLRDRFHWTRTVYEPPADQPFAPEQRGRRRVVRGSCCPSMPSWGEPDHRAAYPQDRPSAWIGHRCVQPAEGEGDPNLALDERWRLPPHAIDEGEAIRQLLAGLFGPDRPPADPTVQARIEALTPGSTVADIGCGLGALSLELARRVGPSGRVYAVDVDQQVLDFARAQAAERGLEVVQTILAEPRDTRLPAACCDRVLLYDMVPGVRAEDLPGFAASLGRALAPGGRLWLYHHPGEPRPQAAIAALEAQGLVVLEAVAEAAEPDPEGGEEPAAAPTKLWVFGRAAP
jgi:SAM-dependent methyltransferase